MLSRGSQKHQDRVLALSGVTVLAVIALVVILVVAHPFRGRDDSHFSIVINTPYIGQGVAAGTAVVLHGVKVGNVVDVAGVAGGGVRLVAELEKGPVRGLTDAMTLDFRPINYFGVAGVNLRPNRGGRVLHEGSVISSVPVGNFTLSELLSRLGDVSAASLTPQLVQVIDKVTRYTDGLNPLFETAAKVTRAAAAIQTVPTEQLLTNAASIVGAFPEFTDSALEATRRTTDFSYYPGLTCPPPQTVSQRITYPYLECTKVENLADESEEYFQAAPVAFAKIASDGLFAAVGQLERSHVDDLYGLIAGIKAITDVTPPLLRPQDLAQKLAELRSRFERLYAGNGDQRAISVRVVLDSLPGIAAPIGIVMEGSQ
ncbi:mammalian cell entry protein [Mycobacterium sp. CVI_P3]|uniref:Mammalian cell entry protein n=1 Tax=Mycobacterium pinniadriaticum TaxID=2994102 RepID=A0ABT3SBW5_9MYCO|nr:mammalian cell entry protein [Mycobacterium pinniadriaticum]MCX2930581.1 mammalian cell entry protein [Mycobacterium pinniadriaticum]MCX2937005.1 mammalian cell entry protein [Mycobacterium pinniadriaticum]